MAQNSNLNTSVLESKPHFEILDGLRGLAALAVVVYHFMEIVITDYSKNFIAHGFLAVDFFFCLSGFVMAYAYDTRITSMSLSTFIKLRLIRLQPLVVIGSVLGLITFLLDPFSNLYGIYGFLKTSLLFITSLLLIPYPIVEERYYNLFNFNAPSWSLFWEYIANVIYALFLFKITKKVLVILISIAFVGLFYVCFTNDNLMGGWSGPTFLHGFVRVSFSFLLCLLIYRMQWVIKNKLGFIGVGALLLLAFVIPYKISWNWYVEPLIIALYFPLIIALGAGTTVSNTVRKLNAFSGDISYPLYMTHYPFLWVFATYVSTQSPTFSSLVVVILVATVLLILLAYLIFKFIDLPIRNHLKSKLKKA